MTVTILLYYCYQPLDFRSSNCIVGILRNIDNIACICLLVLFCLLKHPVLVFLQASHMYALRTYFYVCTVRYTKYDYNAIVSNKTKSKGLHLEKFILLYKTTTHVKFVFVNLHFITIRDVCLLQCP